MVNEFNKLVADTLATEGAVYLPGVGSLVVVRRAAERISSQRLHRAYNTVVITGQACGRPVTDVAAEACGTDAAGGAEIYERWKSKVTADGVMTIEGVGRIGRERFVVDESFYRLLNPNGDRTVELVRHRKSDAWIWWLTAVAVIVAAVCALYFTGLYERRGEIVGSVASWFAPKAKSATPEHVAAEMTVAEQIDEDADGTTLQDSGFAATEAAADDRTENTTEIAAESQKPQTPTQAVPSEGVGRLTSGRSYVVCGVFSTPENALRAVAELRAMGMNGSSAFGFGTRYMVALYSSDDAAECSAFMRDTKGFDDLWLYKAR